MKKNISFESHKPPSPTRPFWCWGVHTVKAILKNPQRNVFKLAAVPNKMAEFQALAPHIPATCLRRPDLDRLLGTPQHTGVAAYVSALPAIPLSNLLDHPQPLILVLDHVQDPHNFGSLMRVAATFGFTGLIATKDNSPPLGGSVLKAASGASEIISLSLVTSLSRSIEALKKANIWCLGLSEHGSSMLPHVTLQSPLAVIVGQEGSGLRRLTAQNCDILVRIPTSSHFSTLSVVQAATVGLYHCALTSGKLAPSNGV